MMDINYNALFEHNTDAIIIVNQQGMIIHANDAFYALTQYELEGFQGRRYETFFQCVHDNEELTEFDQRSQLICQDRTLLPVIIRKIVNVDVFFVVIKDMRVLDAIAENYLQSELRYRQIAENIQDVLILMDEHKNYLYVSPSAQQMYAFDYTQLEHSEPFFYIHPDYVPPLTAFYDRAVADGESFTIKLKAWHASRQWFWTELTGKPMFEDGKFKHILIVARDISAQQKYEENLAYYAYTDMLTNLPNRRKQYELLHEALETVSEQPFAVMLMGIDHFKFINDYYGHEIGDLVLQQFSARIVEALGIAGTVCRQGGDEFVVILPYRDLHEVEQAAASILESVCEPIEIQQTSISITSSIGIAVVTKKTTVRNMMKRADEALYIVKNKGKNQYYIEHL